nr:isoform 3 of probable adp-ribosylation factor gtpase-activating protein agd14 [Quercus suber]
MDCEQGPQYVCTNFWTFVCTICSGVHREFSHRVKSISMANFSAEEVSALQGGGNEITKPAKGYIQFAYGASCLR